MSYCPECAEADATLLAIEKALDGIDDGGVEPCTPYTDRIAGIGRALVLLHRDATRARAETDALAATLLSKLDTIALIRGACEVSIAAADQSPLSYGLAGARGLAGRVLAILDGSR